MDIFMGTPQTTRRISSAAKLNFFLLFLIGLCFPACGGGGGLGRRRLQHDQRE